MAARCRQTQLNAEAASPQPREPPAGTSDTMQPGQRSLVETEQVDPLTAKLVGELADLRPTQVTALRRFAGRRFPGSVRAAERLS